MLSNQQKENNLAWDDDKRAKAVELYLAKGPTEEDSMEIVAEVAEELNESVNGVRAILSKAEVYIKKTPKATESKGASTSTRVSKEDAQNALVEAIESVGKEADMDIISKLTGKAALYLAGVIKS